MELPSECHACTQVGVPVFHSTTWSPLHTPQWAASAGSSLIPIDDGDRKRPTAAGGLRRLILDPRSENVRMWNMIILLARGIALAIDPVFFFSISVGGEACPCVYMDGSLAAAAAIIRTCADLVHVCHLLIRFRLAYVSRESLVVGCGKLVWNPRAIASHYLLSSHGFWFDAFVVLPVHQAIYWLVVPWLLRENKIGEMMTILQLTFLFQFIPKVYHCFSLMHGMRKATGYIFGTVWWGFSLNLVAYFLASHASGGYWYILAVRRVAMCISKTRTSSSCWREVFYPTYADSCGNHVMIQSKIPPCLDVHGQFPYGIYQFALPLMSSNSFMIKLFYANLWGLMALSTMGNNLEPTSQLLEVVFSISMVLSGLLLFTMLIGNIQVFLHAVMKRRRKMQLRHRDMEWWMKHRQLPAFLRRRVRNYEHRIWETTGGEDEMEVMKDLPEGLRRDVKRYIWLDLIKKVPLFHNLDDLVLDNICDRVKPLVYSRNEKIIKQGEPVRRLVFIVDGRVKRSRGFGNGGGDASNVLERGSFLGDELISWCLRRSFLDRLPASSATFTCVCPAEALALEAEDLRYMDHFWYQFANEGLKRTQRSRITTSAFTRASNERRLSAGGNKCSASVNHK